MYIYRLSNGNIRVCRHTVTRIFGSYTKLIVKYLSMHIYLNLTQARRTLVSALVGSRSRRYGTRCRSHGHAHYMCVILPPTPPQFSKSTLSPWRSLFGFLSYLRDSFLRVCQSIHCFHFSHFSFTWGAQDARQIKLLTL